MSQIFPATVVAKTWFTPPSSTEPLDAISFTPVYHNDMIAMPSLYFRILRTCRGGSFNLKSYFFKLRIQISSGFPSKCTTLTTRVSMKLSFCYPDQKTSPARALSSENSLATSSNFTPACNLASASSFLACFSH